MTGYGTEGRPEVNAAMVLHIGGEQTVVTSASAATITLAMGSAVTASHFRHSPPTAAEMENAIMLVEDELFRIRHSITKGATLSTTDASVRAIARIVGIPDQTRLNLTRDSVEGVFNRLAAIVEGRPASQDSIPTTPEFAATLLILREFMHHMDFASIDVIS